MVVIFLVKASFVSISYQTFTLFSVFLDIENSKLQFCYFLNMCTYALLFYFPATVTSALNIITVRLHKADL